MFTTILATKLRLPIVPPHTAPRPQVAQRLKDALEAGQAQAVISLHPRQRPATR